MDFGDRSKFAITVELDENYNGAWLFGKFCYWADGMMIGDYKSGTSLRDVLLQATNIHGDSGKRFCQDLFCLGKIKFSLLFRMFSMKRAMKSIYIYIKILCLRDLMFVYL